MRISHSIALSALLLSSIDAQIITGTQTIALNGQTRTGDIIRGGNLTVNSSGSSMISQMTMLGASTATFNINGGNLSLDLSILNSNGVQNNVNFNVTNNSTLTLTNGIAAAGQTGLFSGSNTTLLATVQGGSTLNGHLSNNADTTLNFNTNSTMKGNITQNGGSLDATLNGTIDGNITLANTTTELSATAAKGGSKITGSITQTGGNLSVKNQGTLTGVLIEGSFTQSQGTSTLKFSNAEFQKVITISSRANADFTLQTSTIQDLLTQDSTTLFSLENSTLKSYTGKNGANTLNLSNNSAIQNLTSQSGGTLNLTAVGSHTQNITASSNADLSINLSQTSTINGSIISNTVRSTTIISDSSTITGNISQTDGLFHASLTQSDLQGNYSQTGGTLDIFSATGSRIGQGIILSGVATQGATQLNIDNSQVVQGGIQVRNSIGQINGRITNNSTINGGFDQTNRNAVHLFFDNSTLNNGIKVRDGGGINGDMKQPSSYATVLIFENNSTLDGGVTSNNHSIWLDFKSSNAQNSGFTITGGDIYLRGVDNSNINGDINYQGNGNAYLLLSQSALTGNINQNNGNQTVILIDGSTITGTIHNTEVNSVFDSNGGTLTGSYSQDNGMLNMLLGGGANINGNVLLNNVQTTLGNGFKLDQDGNQLPGPQPKDEIATIKGNLTQDEGTLQGVLNGLTLEGQFAQNGGVANVTFGKANFLQPLNVNNATPYQDPNNPNTTIPSTSQIVFTDHANLKTTTISNSKDINNSFMLDDNTTLDGNFILSHSTIKLSVINNSKITGSIVSNDPDNDLKLDFGGTGNEIGGDLDIKGGHLEGDLTGTIVKGSIKLEDADTHLHIVDSAVNQGISITRGQTYMTIDNSTIGTGFTMTGLDMKGRDPTLGLSINNGTKIDGNLEFQNTTVSLGGLGNGNTITGSLVTTNTTLTTGGDDFNEPNHNPAFPSVSGLTIEQQLKQINGSMNLTLSNKSAIKGLTSFDNTQQSHLELLDSTMSVLEVSGGNNNEVTLDQGSAQDGGITLIGATTTIKALGQSTITGNINSTATAPATSDTTLILSESTLTGNINQDNGNLTLDFSQNSSMVGITTLNNLNQYQATLSQSSITGNFNTTKSNIQIDLSNGSLIDGDFNLTSNPSFTLDASASTLQGNIVHTGEVGQGQEIKLNFTNGSTLNNEGMTITGDLLIQSSDSQINSRNGITLALGSLELSLSNSIGTIESIATGGSNTISILTTNSSNSTINKITMSDESKLTLTGQNEAILNGDIELENKATATIVSLGNANLKVNITPSTTSTLGVTLNGGILEGTITQTPLASVGTMTLGTAGNFGGRWIATGDSSIKTLNITNSSGNVANEILMLAPTHTSNISMIDTTFDPGGISRIGMNMLKAGGNPPQAGETLERTVSMGSLSGLNGVFRVYTDIGAEASDKISTATATGNHIMQVYYNPATFTQDVGDRYIVVAHVDDQQTTASFEGGITLVGTQVYTTSLTKVTAQNGQGFDWILGKTQNAGANYGTKVISSILQSQYRSFALQTESLRQRMGELRDTNRVHGLWGRYTMGTTYTPESDVAVEIEDNFYSAWIGYDQNVLDLKGQDFFGFALSYSLLNPQGEDYTGNVHSIGFNFYNTFIARNDFYVDLVIKYILSMANYEISYYSLAKNTPEYINHKLMINAEIGKKFKLSESKNYFFLQPEAQITAGYIFGDEVDFVDFTQTTIKSSTSGIAPVILRTGLSAGYSLNQGIKSDFYIGTSFFYETTNGGDVHLDDGNNTVNYSHKGTFKMSFQGGFDLLFTDNARVYFEAGTSFLGKTNMTYSINAGARFSFGYKNTRKLIVPSSITPPPPPQEPYDPRNIPVITDYTQEDIRNNNSLKPRANGGGDDYFINTRKAYRDKSTVEKTIRSR